MNGLLGRWQANLAVDSSEIAPARRRDWALAVFFAIGAVLEVVLASTAWPPVVLAVALFACAALPRRRQRPLELAVAAFAAQFAVDVAAGLADRTVETLAAQDFAGLVLVYALCRWAAPQRAAVGMAVLSVFVVVGAIVNGDSLLLSLSDLVFWVIIALAAVSMRYRGGLLAAQQAQVRLAERNLLARELHDTVAHHVSAIAVQAQAAQFIGQTDPDAAMKAVGDIERAANAAIDEMRQMVGILRSDGDQARTVSETSLSALAEPSRVHLSGLSDLTGFPAPVASAVYRIAQESITNAMRHSSGLTFVDVDLAADDTEVRLEVVNDGSPRSRSGGSGFGLIGMQERVDALGGTIETGPRPASGWRVAASIPLHGSPT